MKSAKEILAKARPERAFANSSDFEIFHWNTCRHCAHDTLDNESVPLCAILDATLIGVTPRELVRNDGHRVIACAAKETLPEYRARLRSEQRHDHEESHNGGLFGGTE